MPTIPSAQGSQDVAANLSYAQNRVLEILKEHYEGGVYDGHLQVIALLKEHGHQEIAEAIWGELSK